MRVHHHILLGGGAALAAVPVFQVEGAVVLWASSVLIDADHYWDFLLRNGFRDWSPRQAVRFHLALFHKIHRSDFLALNVLHTGECMLLVLLAGLVLGPTIIAAFCGMLFHMLLDLAWLGWHRAITRRALSCLEYWLRHRALLRAGLDPDGVYREALIEIGVPTASATSSPLFRRP